MAYIASSGRKPAVQAGAVDPQGAARVLWGSKPHATRRWARGSKEATSQSQRQPKLIDREGWTSPKTAPGPPCPPGRLRGCTSCAFRSLSFLFLLGQVLSPRTPSPAFPGDFGTRDPSDKVSWFLFCFSSSHQNFFFPTWVSEKPSLMTLSISQHERSGYRGQRNWLRQDTPKHPVQQPRWGRACPPWLSSRWCTSGPWTFSGFSFPLIAETRSPLGSPSGLRAPWGCVTASHCHMLF